MNFQSFAWKNLSRRPVRTLLTAGGVALAVAMAVSLGGFNLGYKDAIAGSIEQLGFQVMVMAKGCPYEAATMMLKGGTGMLYLPDEAYTRIKDDPDIEALTPIFVGIAAKDSASIDSDGGNSAFTILAGVDVESFKVMKPWLTFKGGVGYQGGRWLSIPEVQVVSLEQVKGALVSLVGTAQTMVAAVALIAVVVAVIGVVNTILMSVYERIGEIGIMKAVGASGRQVFRLVWSETLLICLVGAGAGCVLAMLGSGLTDRALRHLLNLGVSRTLVRITPLLLVWAVAGSIVLGMLAGVWPARRAAGLRPVEAIRADE